MKPTKLLLLLIVAVLGFFAAPAYADLHPNHTALDPNVCFVPAAPVYGQPGWTSANPLPNGAYYDPQSGYWYFPDGLITDDGSRTERMIEISQDIEDLLRPSWATGERTSEGKYYFPGGYSENMGWYEPGYYYAEEIW